MLSYEVMKGLDAGDKLTLNFKGYMAGNEVTDAEFDGNALVPFAHGMGLISDELYEEVSKVCQRNYYSPANNDCESQLEKVDQVVKSIPNRSVDLKSMSRSGIDCLETT